jgi:probable F420-dependent oxidoreductase
MQLGALVPFHQTDGDPDTVREYAQALEAAGYDFLEAPDHVLGANVASRPGWDPDRNTSRDLIHDPFVLLTYVSGVAPKLALSTGVLILAQRQAVLVAKQAAGLDVLCKGRFRLGIGIGWNEVEFTGLNENFRNRGRRSEEQVAVMRALWKDAHVTFKGKYHTIDDAGINPRPASGHLPVWYGGHHEKTFPRIAKWGDGWIMNNFPPGQTAFDLFDDLRRMTEAEGRDPKSVGIEVWTSCGEGNEADWRAEAADWKAAGVTHLCLTTAFHKRHFHRSGGSHLGDHLAAIRRYREVVADIL